MLFFIYSNLRAGEADDFNPPCNEKIRKLGHQLGELDFLEKNNINWFSMKKQDGINGH